MNLLIRKASSKSLSDRENRGRAESQNAIAAERAQSESKPSLLNRLRRSSRSREREDQKGVEASISPDVSVALERPRALPPCGSEAESSAGAAWK
jgi:hypothetical protein